jgi:hypothetical protein
MRNNEQNKQNYSSNSHFPIYEQVRRIIKQLESCVDYEVEETDFQAIAQLSAQMGSLLPDVLNYLTPVNKRAALELIEDLPDYTPEGNSMEDLKLFRPQLLEKLRTLHSHLKNVA